MLRGWQPIRDRGTRAERRDRATADTRARILDAARACLLADGYASLSTRGSPRQRTSRSARSTTTSARSRSSSSPSWPPRTSACLSGRRRCTAATSRSGPLGPRLRLPRDRPRVGLRPDPPGDDRRRLVGSGVAASVRELLGGWSGLLTDVARREEERGGGLGPFTPDEVAALMGLPFLGAEAVILLGITEVGPAGAVGAAQGRRCCSGRSANRPRTRREAKR